MHTIAHLLSLSLAATPLLIGFYLVYKLLLAGDARHRLNRLLLAIVPPLSFGALPLARYLISLSHSAPDNVIRIVSAEAIKKPSEWILWVYAAGMAVMLLLTIITYIRIVCVISRGKKETCGNYTLVVTDNTAIVPFSWWRYIVIPKADFDKNADVIVLHEKYHLNHNHWLDLVISQIVIIVNWFNPAAWLLMEELKSVHEFQADSAVIASGADARNYQMLLVAKAMGSRFPTLANSFSPSSLKRRVNMMITPRKHRDIGLRIGAILLTISAAVCLILTPKSDACLRTIELMGIRPQVVDRSLDGVNLFVNGKKISSDEMESLKPSNIRSITINKSDKDNTIISIDYENQ